MIRWWGLLVGPMRRGVEMPPFQGRIRSNTSIQARRRADRSWNQRIRTSRWRLPVQACLPDNVPTRVDQIGLDDGESNGVAEGRNGMVQEVEGGDTELKVLPFGDVEGLVQGQVAVKEGRPMDVRHIHHTIGALSRKSETIAVDILIGLEVRGGTTRQSRLQRNAGSTESNIIGQVWDFVHREPCTERPDEVPLTFTEKTR